MKADVDFLRAETRRLELRGIVQGGSFNAKPLHPHPKRGRKKIHESAARKRRAYRERARGSRVLRNRIEDG